MSRSVHIFLKESGIWNRLIVPLTPEQDGVAKHKNCSSMDMVIDMLIDSGLPYKHWSKVAMTEVYLQNRLLTTVTEITPYELRLNSKPREQNTVQHLDPWAMLIYQKKRDPSRTQS